jgi:hypothetical protein
MQVRNQLFLLSSLHLVHVSIRSAVRLPKSTTVPYVPAHTDISGFNNYSGPSNFKWFDVRTTLNSNKQFEENPVLKLEQKLESRTKNHVVAFSLCLVQMKEV